MNEAELKSTIGRAITDLFEHQRNILEFTSETGQTEWNLAHHLAVELRKYFPALDYDLEVIKRDYDNRRPDIIFHKRGTNISNHLVVEVKREGSPGAIDADTEKIKEHWFREPLHYEFGAVVNIRTDGKYEIRVLKNANSE